MTGIKQQQGSLSMGSERVNFLAVKAAVRMTEVLQSYGVDWLRSPRPNQLQGRCPIHGGGRIDAFHVSLSKNAFQCFACQARGNVLDFVAAMEQCSVREAALLLKRRFSISGDGSARLEPVTPGWRSSMRSNWLGKNEAINKPLSFALRAVDGSHPYLTSRGIFPETAAHFGVGFYGGPGLMNGRLVIPIHNASGELVAYAGRSLDGAPPKYRLPARFVKSHVLFNFHRAAALDEKTVVVVEGYFDCLKVHQAGFPSVVALMGTALFPVTETLLSKRFQRVILMLDADNPGHQAADRIATQLASKCSVGIVRVPVGSQPDQLNQADITALLVPNLVPDDGHNDSCVGKIQPATLSRY
jgi:DNA primase